jgi:thymidylate kinase
MIEGVLLDLRAAGVEASARKEPPPEWSSRGGELDLAVARSDWDKARRVLHSQGWRYLHAPGRPGHRFMLRAADGRWFKIDSKLSPERSVGVAFRGLARVRTKFPVSLRRVGPVVAVLGPDGAGKGSVIAALNERVPVAITVVYFGSRQRARSATEVVEPQPAPPAWRESAWLIVRLIRTWRRLASVYAKAWRGTIVLCDRHPLEVLAVRPERRPFNKKLERFLLSRLVPRPDAIVVLDAPGEVLFDRKGEHSAEILERWRANYLEEFVPRGARIVSSEGDMQETVASVSQHVWEALCERRRW